MTAHALQLWSRWMIEASWQIALWVSVVALVDRCLRRRLRPSLRGALWSAALIKCVLPPGQAAAWSPVTWLRGRWFGGGAAASPELAGSSTDFSTAAASTMTTVAFVVWALGLAAILSWSLWRGARLRARIVASSEPAPKTLCAAARRAADTLGMRRLPELRVGAGLPGPGVFGARRPIVFLPRALQQELPSAMLEHVLLHELAHVRRRDGWRDRICRSLAALYWFHPAAWLLCRRIAAFREIACDAAVGRALGQRRQAYRLTLLRLAEGWSRGDLPAWSGFSGGTLVDRLRWLGRDGVEPGPWRRTRPAALFAAVLLLFAPMGALKRTVARVSPEVQAQAQANLDALARGERVSSLRLWYSAFALQAAESADAAEE